MMHTRSLERPVASRLGWRVISSFGAAAVALACLAGPAMAQEKPKSPPFADVVKDYKVTDGLLKLYQKDNRLLAEVSPGQLNKDLLVLVSIAKGIGEGSLLGGMSLGFGDDWLWQFRKVGDGLHLVRVNTRFQATAGTPESSAVKNAYTDSVLYNLPIITNSPSGGYLVDLSPVFFSDLPQISLMMPGFMFSSDRSSWESVKGFKDNVELQVAATYGSRGTEEFDTVPDSRGLTVTVHYSISQLPSTGYKPRQADDRVGYFLTVVKDYSVKSEEERFIRYINRWDLQKADPSAELSPPKKPIIFWMEKTIPFQYRKPIRDGILEWNKAFEKAGFLNAIEVRQQDETSTWDPEDVNYNTFRWITSSAGFAMGPSRVNPRTGQILDADIIFDADFVQFWKHSYETFTPASVAAMTNGPLDIKSYEASLLKIPSHLRHSAMCKCDMATGFQQQLAYGSAVLQGMHGAEAKGMEEKLIMQGLKEVTMHEVGHTLGLRHNFKSSTIYTLEELNDPAKVKETGLTGSVMDYSPANMVPKGMKQGDFFSETIGPYDYWAIEYGYKALPGGTDGEVGELKKIASKSGKPELAYSTDEDTRGIDSDPLSNRFDMGKDPVAYAKQQAQLVSELWPDIAKKLVKEGDGYQKARQGFSILLGTHARAMFFAARNISGIYVNRDHKGDTDARAPFVVVDAAKQRETLKLIEEQVLSDKPFQFPPELLNHLSTTRWSHWGVNSPSRLDYPIHDQIALWQARILYQMMNPLTLQRLHDSELKVAADADAFTTAELLERLTAAVFSETKNLPAGDYTNRKPAISSLRRNLQRHYLRELSELALGRTSAPDDCQTVAYIQLVDLQGQLKALSMKEGVKLDTYSRAHVQETIERIGKVLDARLVVASP